MDILTGYGAPLRLIARPQWLAQPPSHVLNPLEMPATRVIIAHTATEQCSTQVNLYTLNVACYFTKRFSFVLRPSVFSRCVLSRHSTWTL